MKVVINACYGGFSLSEKAAHQLGYNAFDYNQISRTNPELIALIESAGSDYVSGKHAKLKVVEFPEQYFEIQEHAGRERIRAFISPIPESRIIY